MKSIYEPSATDLDVSGGFRCLRGSSDGIRTLPNVQRRHEFVVGPTARLKRTRSLILFTLPSCHASYLHSTIAKRSDPDAVSVSI